MNVQLRVKNRMPGHMFFSIMINGGWAGELCMPLAEAAKFATALHKGFAVCKTGTVQLIGDWTMPPERFITPNIWDQP